MNRLEIWELLIDSIASISKDSKTSEVGMKQIYKHINENSVNNSRKQITMEQVFLSLTENSDCLELFQLEHASHDDFYFSLRYSREQSLKKAHQLNNHGIKEILKENQNDFAQCNIKTVIQNFKRNNHVFRKCNKHSV